MIENIKDLGECLDQTERDKLDGIIVAWRLMGREVFQFKPSSFGGSVYYTYVFRDDEVNLYLEYEYELLRSKLSSMWLGEGKVFNKKETLAIICCKEGERTDRLFEVMYSKL